MLNWLQNKKMVLLTLLLCLTFAISAVNVQAISSNETGIHDGYYYSFWTDGGGSVNMTLGSGGNYSVNWTNCNNFTCGKGWKTGAARNITFSGSFNGGNNGFLAVYGWFTNPLVEYYIVENYGNWTPPGATSQGTITSDGGTYNLYRTQRINQPSIESNSSTFYQYWSVRTSKRSSGTVTTANHFNAWRSKGWNMGTFNYQIMETEGYQSSGSSNITVSEGGSNPTPTPTATSANGSTVQCENMTTSGQYTSTISSPFNGIALYGNNDAVSANVTFSGASSITLYGASNNSSTAQVSVYIGSSKVGTCSFAGTSKTGSTVNFTASGTQTVKFVVENDNGNWDAYLDYFTIGGGSNVTPTPTQAPINNSTVQCESMSTSGQYTSTISSPFNGIALYGNNDAVSTSISFSGASSITLYGASSNSSTAQVSVYVGNSKVGTCSFAGTSKTGATVNFTASGSQTVKFVMENDNGSWDAYLDYFTVSGGSNNASPTPTNGGNYSGYVYLGFDDGPNNNTPTLVNNLKNAGAKATFFVWGNRISSNTSGFNAIKNAGFSIQNHSYTHSHMTSWSYQQVYNDLQQCQQAIKNAGGGTPTKIRLPYLESNSTIQSACSALGLSVVNTTVDTQDWNQASTSAIISACNSLQNGGCALMHDGYSTTNAAISSIVQNLKNRGLGTAQY